MSRRPTSTHTPTPGGIRSPEIYKYSAFQGHIINGLVKNLTVAQTEKDKSRMFDMIKERIQSVGPKLDYDQKEYVIPIKSFSVTANGPVYSKKNMELSFWLPINKGYSIHVTIDVNSLTEENMEKVNFHDNSAKICSLYELYCYATGIPMTDNMLTNFMTSLRDKPESMHRALKRAFSHGTLVITWSDNKNFLDIIEKAGRLSKQYTDADIPRILGGVGSVGLKFLSHGPTAGGRGRQRRKGRSLLSRKKRNTRMKKSKKYNKSKKIKN
jgi:hypothetical protein